MYFVLNAEQKYIKKRGSYMICNKCGAEIKSTLKFCNKCGAKVVLAPPKAPSTKVVEKPIPVSSTASAVSDVKKESIDKTVAKDTISQQTKANAESIETTKIVSPNKADKPQAPTVVNHDIESSQQLSPPVISSNTSSTQAPVPKSKTETKPNADAASRTNTAPKAEAKPQTKKQSLPQTKPKKTPAPLKPKNKVVAGLLAIFLGFFGIHWFYLGKPIRAAIYIVVYLVCPFIWLLYIVEGIYFLCAKKESFDKYRSKW